MKRYRSILSVAFAFLVLFSSSSFIVGVHLCRGQIRNVALFTKADECEMEKQMPPCHKQLTKPCCEDETIVHEAEDFKVTSTDITLTVPVADMEWPPVFISEVIPAVPLSRTAYHHYDPPLRAADLTVSYQVFLI